MAARVWKVRYLRLVRKVHRLLRHRHLRHREWWKPIAARLLDRRLWQPCRDSVAGGFSVGLFFAMMFMPGQTIAAAVVAARLRVNIPFAVGACFLTNPLTAPFIRLTQLRFGGWLDRTLGMPVPHLGEVDVRIGEAVVHLNVSNFIVGFLLSGIILGLIAYPLVHLFSAFVPQLLPIKPPVLRNRRKQREKPAS